MRLNTLATIMSATLCYMARARAPFQRRKEPRRSGPTSGPCTGTRSDPCTRSPAIRLMRAAITRRGCLWGDTHLHTANSLDAAAFGDTLGPEEAYRFARGEEVVSSTGQPVKLSRPLDFLVVADHAEALGSTVELKKGNPLLMADPALKRWHDMMNSDKGGEAAIELIRSIGTGTTPKALFNPKLARSVWQNYTATAERYNEPGRFTALIGYEWTSNNQR